MNKGYFEDSSWDLSGRSGTQKGERRQSRGAGAETPAWPSASTVSPRAAVHDPIPQLTVAVHNFDEFPDVPGEAAAINLKRMLQLLPPLLAECALRPRLQEADGVRLIAPSIELQLPQPREAVRARPAAVGEGGDLEAAEGVSPLRLWGECRSEGPGAREGEHRREKEEQRKQTNSSVWEERVKCAGSEPSSVSRGQAAGGRE